MHLPTPSALKRTVACLSSALALAACDPTPISSAEPPPHASPQAVLPSWNEGPARSAIIVFGNSDGDYEMLEWVTTGRGLRLGLIVHHTDDEREFAYDRDAHVGRLAKALDAAPARGWIVVDMKRDWNRVFR